MPIFVLPFSFNYLRTDRCNSIAFYGCKCLSLPTLFGKHDQLFDVILWNLKLKACRQIATADQSVTASIDADPGNLSHGRSADLNFCLWTGAPQKSHLMLNMLLLSLSQSWFATRNYRNKWTTQLKRAIQYRLHFLGIQILCHSILSMPSWVGLFLAQPLFGSIYQIPM